jgi:hypothetical protein
MFQGLCCVQYGTVLHRVPHINPARIETVTVTAPATVPAAAAAHLMLKEVEVQVALKASHKGDGAGLPLHLVGERQAGTAG